MSNTTMIRSATGNLIDADAEALVNTVNCVGVMGKGLALQFKRAFPANFAAYECACREGSVQPGRLFVFELGGPANPRSIINFPTKRHWRDDSRLEDIESGLHALAAHIRQRGIRTVAVPALGCGLGGLSWSAVRPLIERSLGAMDGVEVLLYEPAAVPGTR